MNTSLQLNTAGLVLLAINGTAVATPPTKSINLLDVISVLPGSVVNYSGTQVPTIHVTVKGIRNYPDDYDFAVSGNSTATATAGITVGSVTVGDSWQISVNGVNYTYTTVAGDTAATILSAMLSLLYANTQGFTATGTNTTGTLLITLTGPANSSALNGYVVTSTNPTNVGPTFSAPVETNFSGGSGIAEQFTAFLNANLLTSELPLFTGLIQNNTTYVKNLPSFMINARWYTRASYNSTKGQTTITYEAPLGVPGGTQFKVLGNQTQVINTFNV